MERKDALMRLNELVGRDVHGLAITYGVQVRSSSGNVNKGWAGHVFERHLGLPLNSAGPQLWLLGAQSCPTQENQRRCTRVQGDNGHHDDRRPPGCSHTI